MRSLVRRPGVSVLALAVLALGIGANAAIFSLVDAVLFRPLPVRQPDRLVRLFSASSPDGGGSGRVSLPFVEDYRAASSLASLEMWSGRLPVDVFVEGGSAARLTAVAVSPGFFDSLGVRPAIGRLPASGDAEQAAAVLSDHLWRRAFGRDPAAVGGTLHVNRRPFVIVGVAPPGFQGVDPDIGPDVWLPLAEIGAAMPAWRGQIRHRSSVFFHAVGRLAPGRDVAAARAELLAIASRSGAGRPARLGPETEDASWREPWPWIEPAAQAAGRNSRALARLLAGVAGLVLALACVNTAGLMLARAERRRRELALRAALGATRWRLVRPLVLEAVLLSAAGTAAGVLVAHLAVDAMSAAAGESGWLLRGGSGVLTPRVLVLAAAMAAVATVLSGVWPALRAAGRDPLAGLRNDAPGGAARWFSTRGMLVSVQVAVATVLLIAVGVLLRSLWAAARIEPGIDPHAVAAVDLDLARAGYGTARAAAFVARLEGSLRDSAGGSPVALAVGAPLEPGPSTTVTIDGRDAQVDFAMVTAGYFEALGLPLASGRGFQRGDGARAIVSRAFVQRFWPESDPIGRQIGGFGPQNAVLEVTAVAADMRSHGLQEPVRPVLYVPLDAFYGAFPWPFGLTALLRAPEGPRHGTATIARAVQAADPWLPILRPRSLAETLGAPFRQQRFLAILLGGFAALALLLAGAGLHGVVALATESRMRDFGIRVALGALPRHLHRRVHGRSLALCAVGLAGGSACAVAAHRALQPFAFGVSALDPWALAAGPVVLTLVSVVAAAGPASRAGRVDPAEALRQE